MAGLLFRGIFQIRVELVPPASSRRRSGGIEWSGIVFLCLQLVADQASRIEFFASDSEVWLIFSEFKSLTEVQVCRPSCQVFAHLCGITIL